MKKMFAALAAVVAVSMLQALPSPGYAQGKVHAIMLGDTLDPGIGQGAGKNVEGIERLVTSIGNALGVAPNFRKFIGADFGCANLNNAVRTIGAGADDVVIFYYSGHGFREDGQKSQFPRLWCKGPPTDNPLLQDIAGSFGTANAPPRLVWAVADACNVTTDDSNALTAGVGPAQLALKKLFGRHSGTLIQAGADMHQFSWYYPTGGLFSRNLLDAMAFEMKQGNAASWDRFITNSKKPFQVPYNGKTFFQQPIALSTLIEQP
jgi:hypothetical protein